MFSCSVLHDSMMYYWNTKHHRGILLTKVLIFFALFSSEIFLYSVFYFSSICNRFFYKYVLNVKGIIVIVLLFCDILGTFSNGSWYEREALEMKRCQYLFVISLHTSHHITRWVQISLNALTHWYLNTLTLEDCERMSTERCFVGCLKRELVLLDWCWLFVVNGPLISLQDSHVIHFKIRFMVHVEKHKYFTLNVFDFKHKHCVVSNECHIYCVFSVF